MDKRFVFFTKSYWVLLINNLGWVKKETLKIWTICKKRQTTFEHKEILIDNKLKFLAFKLSIFQNMLSDWLIVWLTGCHTGHWRLPQNMLSDTNNITPVCTVGIENAWHGLRWP